jgi:hypothetical protein
MLCWAYHDFGGAKYTPMQNWPHNFIAMAAEDVEKDELIGNIMDDPSSSGAVLWAVTTAWWLLDLQRRGESLVMAEGKRWQVFLVIITRCLRSVSFHRVCTRAAAMQEEALKEDACKVAEAEALGVDHAKRLPDPQTTSSRRRSTRSTAIRLQDPPPRFLHRSGGQ